MGLISQMRSFLLILICLFGSSNFDYAAGHNWMIKVPDESLVSSLNIPGTHNAGALHEPFPRTAKCQTLTLAKQLESGVRFFDIRCCHQNDSFSIYHGPVSQKLTFESVLNTMTIFLKKNPSEFVILSVKEEHRSNSTARSFAATVRSYIKKEPLSWYTKQGIPRLADVRGKLVLLRRFPSAKPLGIPATDWGHNGLHIGKNIFVQDRFALPDAQTKWKIIEQAFEHSRKDSKLNRLHLHYTSGYTQGLLGIPNITAISKPINKRLMDYLKFKREFRHGCIVVDFMTPELSRAIYLQNFN
jgi:1-phosphatidylinositol phosphodiesterase